VIVVMGLTTFLAGVLWGILYLSFGETFAGYIPLAYSFLCFLNLMILYLHKNAKVYSFIQISLILLLPFFLMFALGGFVNSSAVILWSILAPMAALLTFGRRVAFYWFIAYVGLGIFSGILETSAPVSNNCLSRSKSSSLSSIFRHPHCPPSYFFITL